MAMALLSVLHVVILLLWSTLLAESRPYNYTLVKPGCREYCGEVAIPYPFGIENENSDCYMNPDFAVICNDTSDGPPKPYLKSIGMALLGVSFSMYGRGYVQVNNTVISSNCSERVSTATEVNISGTSFFYSSQYNRFTVMGCDNYGLLLQGSNITGGCLSACGPDTISIRSGITAGCYGIECCQILIPPFINNFRTNMTHVMKDGDSGDCRNAFMVDQYWFSNEISQHDYQSYMESIAAMKQSDYIPAVLEWGFEQGTCDISTEPFCSSNGYCWEEIDQSHLCVCSSLNYESYLDDIDYIVKRCSASDLRSCLFTDELPYCRLLCVDSLGSKNCSCPVGYESYYERCFSYDDVYRARPRVKIILIGCGSGVGLLFLLIGVWWLYKLIKRRKAMKLKQKFFKRNGGLLLQQQLSSSTTNIEQTKLFSSTELEKATDNFNVNRILGQGGQGTVYKGMLTDGRIVAVKKSKVVDEDKLEQFINEVVILSQINHRNVVKLLGCCLEAEVPFLVYEFISNGTLFHHIHSPNQDFQFTWEMRLRIATEIASALSYMHSAASMPIYHRDIKSSNILLDEKFKVKVSDFGTSKSISIDQTHVTTRVQGTFGYLDPEYFQSGQFTDKSDVYSFGVVLIELLTGHKPVFKTQSAEDKNLAFHFLELMEEDRLSEILDEQVTKDASKEEIVAAANIAKRCLNLKGRKRPTMKTIAMELEEIKASKGFAATDKHDDYEEADYMVGTMPPTSWDVTSSSTSYFTSSVRISADADPLLSNT